MCLRIRANGSIFIGALVNIWIAWLCFSALGSSPLQQGDGQFCNKATNQGWLTFIQILGHLFFTYLTMFTLSTTVQAGSVEENKEVKGAAGDVELGQVVAAGNKKNLKEMDDMTKDMEGGNDDTDQLKAKPSDAVS